MTTNTVSPATAARLAAAGFPQPAPAPGQWWGDEESLVFVFQAWIDGKHDFFVVAQTVAGGRPIIDDYFDARDFAGVVFLPTVGDILRELPNGIILWFNPVENNFAIGRLDYGEVCSEVSTHEHPAEAAALAWLYLYEKK